MKTCTIIGISDSRKQWFSPEVLKCITFGCVFSGGKRHHEIMERYLPVDSEWIDITVPLDAVFKQYERFEDIVIFASGDPLFYGFAATVQRECPTCEMKVYPSFNSLQMLAHRMNLPYQDMHVVSLTGRPWDKLDEALISGQRLIGCLTDRVKTPNAIWQRMQEYGYTNYAMTVGENLGNEETERVTEAPPTPQGGRQTGELANQDSLGQKVNPTVQEEERVYAVPNCVILQKVEDRPRPFGIPENEFHLLDGRTRMITKMPIRLLTLSMLELRHRHTFWDVGFCTGSVSIEAKLQFPHLSVTAFEIREEGRELMALNSRKFGVPGITTVIGDFFHADLTQYLRPESVFIGGHGGRLREMMQRIYPLLSEGGVMVMNSVATQSNEVFTLTARELGMTLAEPMHITLNDFNSITILKATK